MSRLNETDRQILLLYKDLFWRYKWQLLISTALQTSSSLGLAVRVVLLAPILQILVPQQKVAADASWMSVQGMARILSDLFNTNEGNLVETSIIVTVLFVLFTGLALAVDLFGHNHLLNLKFNIQKELLLRAHSRLLRFPLAYFHRTKTGVTVKKLNADSLKTAGLMAHFVDGAKSLAVILVVVAILVLTDYLLFVVIALVAPLQVFATKALGRLVTERSRTASSQAGFVSSDLFESVENIKLTKSFAAETYEEKRVGAGVEAHRHRKKVLGLFNYLAKPLGLVLEALTLGVVITAVAYMVHLGRIELVVAGIYIALTRQLNEPIGLLQKSYVAIKDGLGTTYNYMELLQEPLERSGGSRRPDGMREELALRDVSFRYPSTAFTLDVPDLVIRKGQKIAIVGPSGSGKSTILNLLMRFYDPDSGQVLLDGVDICEFDLYAYRRLFGVMSQEVHIYSGSLRDNVVFNRKYEPELFYRVCRQVGLDTLMKRESLTDSTDLGNRAGKLSGGERQRIGLARALYGRPRILLLDEPTSSLDVRSEEGIAKTIEEISTRLTVIAVTHRPNLIRRFDRIFETHIEGHKASLVATRIDQVLVHAR